MAIFLLPEGLEHVSNVIDPLDSRFGGVGRHGPLHLVQEPGMHHLRGLGRERQEDRLPLAGEGLRDKAAKAGEPEDGGGY